MLAHLVRHPWKTKSQGGLKMKTRTFIVILFTLIFVMCAVGVFADDFDWPRWRGPNGDGISMETDWNPEALAGGPKVLWKTVVGNGHSHVVIKKNRLYTVGYNKMYCLNAETGKEIWNHSFDLLHDYQSTPNIDGKFIFALSTTGKLTCLKAKTGKLQWERNLVREFHMEKLVYGYAQSPIIEDSLIIINLNRSGIALDKKTGDKVWDSDVHKIKFESGYYATPVLYNHEGKRYTLLFSGTGLFSVDVHTGNPLWFYEWYDQSGGDKTAQTNAADPIVFDNKVFISSCYGIKRGALLNISGNEPNVLWQNENMKNYFSSSVLVDGYLYGIDEETGKLNTLRCVEWETGHLMWEKKIEMASLIAADGKIIILEEDGTLHIAEATPSSYQEISSGDVLEGEQKGRQFWTPPVLCNGKIYCRNFYGDLVCIDVSK